MTAKPRGICPVCGRDVALRVDGSVGSHNTSTEHGAKQCVAAEYKRQGRPACAFGDCTFAAGYRLTIRQGGSADYCGEHANVVKQRLLGPGTITPLRFVEENQ